MSIKILDYKWLLLILVSVQIHAAELKNISGLKGASNNIGVMKNLHVGPPSNYFFNKNFLNCGSSDILIMTSCIDYAEDMPFCFNQHINIYNKKTSLSSSINYDFIYEGGNQQFIAKVDCKIVDGNNYFILENTNFGNCDKCEWIDVYLENGKYLGSTQGIYNSKNFVHTTIAQEISKALSSSNVSYQSVTRISRARPR